MASFREQSRTEWTPTRDSGVSVNASNDQLKVGCLQRIADATELMAKNHAALVADRDRFEKWYEEECAEAKRLRGTIRALQGHITRLKNKP